MTDENIKSYLSDKFSILLKAFMQPLQDEVYKDSYFAGGCVVDLVLDDTPRDYDVFFVTEAAAAGVKEAFTGKEGVTLKMPCGASFLVKVVTENAVTLKADTGEVFQLVTRFFGDTNRIFRTFDFTHCMAFYSPKERTLFYQGDIIRAKKLVYNGEKDEFPLNTLKRLCKFVARGWTPDNPSIVNLYTAIQNRPPLQEPSENRMQSIGFYGSAFK